MAVTQVRAQIDGHWYTLTYNSETRRYEAYITAPSITSALQPYGYYNVTVEATSDAGVTVTSDSEIVPSLKLYVKEIIAPVITIVAPSDQYITVNPPSILFQITDEIPGSSVNLETLSVSMDGVEATQEEVSISEIENGYEVSYLPLFSLDEGTHAFSISVSDFDGNTGTQTVTYIVDTIPPEIKIIRPEDHVVVDDYSIDVEGEVYDVVIPNVAVSITNNGTDTGEVSIKDGKFTHNVPLYVGENTIRVQAVDGAGLATVHEIYRIRLITDRTQEDVNELNSILKAALAKWTPEQKEEFLKARARGAYTYNDLNRVIFTLEYLANRWAAAGYSTRYKQQKYTWAKEEYFRQANTEAYVGNIAGVRGLFAYTSLPLPEAPLDMEDFTFAEANNIEKILVLTDSIYPYLKKSSWYSNEIFCGEV